MEYHALKKIANRIHKGKKIDCIKFMTVYPFAGTMIAIGGWANYGESPAFTGLAIFLFIMSFIEFFCSIYMIITTLKEGTGIIYSLILQDDGKMEFTTKNFLLKKGVTVSTNINEISLVIDAMTIDMPTYNGTISYNLNVNGKHYYILHDLFADICEINYWLLSRKPDYKVKYSQLKSDIKKLYKEYEANK